MDRSSSKHDKTPPDKDPHKHLELYLKALDVGLWDYDIDADGLTCDARWYAITGLSAGSVTRVADFRPHIHPDDAEHATSIDLAQIASLIERDERYHVEFRIVRPDGEVRRLRSVACLIVDPESGHRRALGCVTDTTDFRDPHPSHPAGAEENEDRLAEDDTSDGLTAKELECLRWVSLGKTAWETATIMGRSQRTVEFHLANAVRKLSATNKIHAAVIAVRRRLI